VISLFESVSFLFEAHERLFAEQARQIWSQIDYLKEVTFLVSLN
jgi:hypothetical protein